MSVEVMEGSAPTGIADTTTSSAEEEEVAEGVQGVTVEAEDVETEQVSDEGATSEDELDPDDGSQGSEDVDDTEGVTSEQEEEEPLSEEEQVLRRGKGKYGCEHYRRRCKLVAPCCDSKVGRRESSTLLSWSLLEI